MPAHTPHNENDELFPDLDALVMAEIESLDRHRREPPRTEPEERQAKVHSIGKPPPAPEPARYFGEEAEILQEALEGPPPEEDAGPEDDIFSPEEHAFMTRAVGFLRGRANADAILGRVWETVTEGDPQAFYSPAETDAADDEVKAGEDPSADTE